MKRLVSALLCLCILLTLLPVSAMAAETVSSGSCGDNLTWELDAEGTLTISGTGDMWDYTWQEKTPWASSYSSIKEVILKNSVTSIGEYAFSGCSSLTSVTIPNSVTSIGEYAFSGCSSLTSVTIPNGVTSIEHGAFSSCSSLTSVIIPNSVTSIENGAFYHCTGLTNVTIPNSVTHIGNYAFRGCSSLTSVTIPNSVTSIRPYAFSDCSSLTSVTIPNSVTSIMYRVFYNCSSLTSVTIPNSVTSIEDEAFGDCNNLREVHITDIAAWCKIVFEVYPSNPLYYAHNLYVNGTLVTDLVIPDGVASIGNGAFIHCSNLTSVTIPNSVTSIGNSAFEDCNNLKEVHITDIATWCKINFGLFNSSNPLYYAHNLYVNGTLLTDLVIPDGVTSIGPNAFCGCSSLTSVTVPNSVTSIESYAFEDCNNLKEVHITDIAAWCKINFGLYGSANPLYCAHNLYVNGILVTDLAIPDGVTSIGPNAFCGYTGSSVMIPNSVTSIGKYAFDGCSGLTSVTIPNSVTSIGRNAFYHCTGLTNVTIPNSVTSIGPNAFCGCSSMTSVMIPSSVTSIGIGVFADCSGLTSVTIPNSVTSIENGAFDGCKSLTSITIPNSVNSMGSKVFYGCDNLTALAMLNPECEIYEDKNTLGSPTQTTIYGYIDSTAQDYAEKYGYTFKTLDQCPWDPGMEARDNLLRIVKITPNHATIRPNTKIEILFNKEVEFGLGTIDLRDGDDNIVAQYLTTASASNISIDGKKVTIDISEWNLKDGAYTATITPRAFKTKDGIYFFGLNDKTEWEFDVCSYADEDDVLDYSKKGILFWRRDDPTKPGIPDGTDDQYAEILLRWAKENGISNLTKEKALAILDQPMYLPVTDMNGATVLLNDKQTTVRQALEDILFFDSLRPFATGIDDALGEVTEYKGGINQNIIRQETDLYEKIISWYPQINKYLKKRSECSPFYSSAAALAYQTLLTAADAAGGTVYSYAKPLLKATLDTSIAQESYAGLTQYADYIDFKNATKNLSTLVKTLKAEGKAVYLAKTDTGLSSAKVIVRLGVDLLRDTFKDSDNKILKEVSTAWDNIDTSMTAGKLCAFLGNSIGAFPMVIELYNKLETRAKHMNAAFYFISDYYIQDKYPDFYNQMFDDTGFPDQTKKSMFSLLYSGISKDDPVLSNWFKYFLTSGEDTYRDKCRQLRFDLVNYIMLLQYAQEFDADTAKNALVRYVSAECSSKKTTQFNTSCPVMVEVYNAATNSLVASLSSEDTALPSSEYGTMYLLGENNETKCFVLNSDAYYAKIIPYGDGTMSISVVTTDENGTVSGKAFRDVQLTSGVGFELNLDDMEEGLKTDTGATIEKDGYIPVTGIDIWGAGELAIGAAEKLSAKVYPIIATNQRLTWKSSNEAVATVDENGVVTSVAEGTVILSASSEDGITENHTITIYTPATGLELNTESLSMVVEETYAVSASVSGNATHKVQWSTSDMNIVTVTEDGGLTARAPGQATVTAQIDGLQAEVLVTVYAAALEAKMYQLDLGGNAVSLEIYNHSAADRIEDMAYIAIYESGQQIGLSTLSIHLPANSSVREKIELPEFVPEKTYSLVFYPIGHDTATQELILVNGAYAVYTSTESAAAELQDCQKDTVTCEDVIDGETYTLYALTDDSGVPSEDNIAYIARKTAEKDQIDFVICPNDDNDMCYVYLSDKTGVLRRVTAINFALKHAYNEKHICTLCGAEDSVAEIILSTLPTKTSYVVDRDMLDVSGGRIMLRYNGGTTEETDLTADMISGFDNTILGKQTLTVTVNNASITFDIEIVEMPVSYVTVEGDKIVLYYNDGITVETSLKEGIVSHFNISETGDKTLTLFSKNACVVAYVNATGDYVRLKASAGEDGSYQYIIPVDITEVTVAVKGDLNSDGQLTVREARQLLRASMDSDFLTKKQFMCADLDGDGSISVREARVLLKASTDSTSITW